MKMLVIYASKHGQTEKIATAVAETARREGADARAIAVKSLPRDFDPRAYDVVVVAGPIYYGKLVKPLRRFVFDHRAALSSVHNALVAVSLSAKFDPATAEREVHAIVEETHWLPETFTNVAGAESFTKYGWFTGYVMRKIARQHGRGGDFSKDREYTDWTALAQFTRGFVGKVGAVNRAAPLSASAVAARP